MYWLMVCPHHPGKDADRTANREAHRAHVASGGGLVRVLIGSALTGDDGASPLGNFGVIEADSRDDVVAFAKGDPYFRAGIVAGVEVTALATTFQAYRIDPMTPPRMANGT